MLDFIQIVANLEYASLQNLHFTTSLCVKATVKILPTSHFLLKNWICFIGNRLFALLKSGSVCAPLACKSLPFSFFFFTAASLHHSRLPIPASDFSTATAVLASLHHHAGHIHSHVFCHYRAGRFIIYHLHVVTCPVTTLLPPTACEGQPSQEAGFFSPPNLMQFFQQCCRQEQRLWIISMFTSQQHGLPEHSGKKVNPCKTP